MRTSTAKAVRGAKSATKSFHVDVFNAYQQLGVLIALQVWIADPNRPISTQPDVWPRLNFSWLMPN